MGTGKEKKKNLKWRYLATIAVENTIFSTPKKPEFRLKPEVAHLWQKSIQTFYKVYKIREAVCLLLHYTKMALLKNINHLKNY